MQMEKGMTEALADIGVWMNAVFQAIYLTIILPFAFLMDLIS